MNTLKHDPWLKLAHKARTAIRVDPPALPQEAPFGFHGRVLSRLGRNSSMPALLAFKLTLRALPIGATLLLACWLFVPFSDHSKSAPEPDLAEMVFEEVLP